MRPLELRLRNFRSFFGDDKVIDFRDRSLVAIVGPTGSGKSTILDAISFALYGRTPSVGRSTKALIHQRADAAAVALRFSVDGDVWEAVRSLRRTGASQHALYRFPSDDPDVEPVEKVTLEADVNERLADLLGMDFDAFGRSVLLAQGRFAEFLEARPGERDRVLKGVFGHERVDAMREIAKDRARDAAAEADKVAFLLEQLEEVQLERDERQAERERAATRAAQLREAEPEATALAEAIERLEASIADLGDKAELLSAVADRLPDQAAADALVREAREAAERRARSANELDGAREILAAESEALEALDEAATRSRIEAATALLAEVETTNAAVESDSRRTAQLTERVDAIDETLRTGSAAVERAEEAAEAADAALTTAVAALLIKDTELHEARHDDMAHVLRSALESGDVCPVCAQVVGDVPPLMASDDIYAAGAAQAEARDGRDAAEAGRSGAASAVEAARSALGAKETERIVAAKDSDSSAAAGAERAGALEVLRSQVVAMLGEGDPQAALGGLRAALAELTEAVATARKAVDRARLEQDDSIAAEQAATGALTELRVRLVDVSTRLDVEQEVGDRPEEVGGAVRRLLGSHATEVTRVEASLASTATERDVVREKRVQLLTNLDVAGDLSAALNEANTRTEMLAGQIARADERLERRGELVPNLEIATATRDDFRRLAADLNDAKFIRYLLDDDRARLAELGSDHFQRLTAGRYRFTDTFDVVDLTAADTVRKAGSLSGGETFLASLALAIALAEMVARTGGRLDSFFLDEGFGTLDPEHLDLAMDGIESLVADSGGRLVVVVSHVSELRERAGDLIVLDRDPVTGDSRVVKG